MADNASSNKTNPAAPTLLIQRQKKNMRARMVTVMECSKS